jgi:hypothetical protein
MITVRASTLESFRLYMDPDCDFISADEIEERIRRGQDNGESPSEAASLGTDFHAAVAGEYFGPRRFDYETIVEARAGLDGSLSEVPGSVVLDVDGTKVRVTGHADWLLGLDVLDLKTSSKPIAPDKHAESMQWRCYVLIFDVERVTYRQVHLDESKEGEVFAKSIEDVVMFPYPKLREDVVTCIRSLLDFARLRGCIDAMDVPDDIVEQNTKPAADYSCVNF